MDNYPSMDNLVQDIEKIKRVWNAGFPEYPMGHTQFANWTSRYGYFIAKHGIEKALRKAAMMEEKMSQLHAVRYATKVMENETKPAAEDIPITVVLKSRKFVVPETSNDTHALSQKRPTTPMCCPKNVQQS